jgi:hypothetical protein
MAHRTVGAKLFGSFTPVRVVLHGLRRSRLVDRRLGGQTTCSWGICHLAEKHPLVSEPLMTIAGNVRNSATVLAVLVVAKGPKPI